MNVGAYLYLVSVECGYAASFPLNFSLSFSYAVDCLVSALFKIHFGFIVFAAVSSTHRQ